MAVEVEALKTAKTCKTLRLTSRPQNSHSLIEYLNLRVLTTKLIWIKSTLRPLLKSQLFSIIGLNALSVNNKRASRTTKRNIIDSSKTSSALLKIWIRKRQTDSLEMAGQPPDMNCILTILSVTSDQMKSTSPSTHRKILSENLQEFKLKTRPRLSQPVTLTFTNTNKGSILNVTILHNLCQSILIETIYQKRKKEMMDQGLFQDYSEPHWTSNTMEMKMTWKEREECFQLWMRSLSNGNRLQSYLESAFLVFNS
jgi:hypothetical protein